MSTLTLTSCSRLQRTVPGQAVASKKSRKAPNRQVSDLPSWLEAWNIFLAIRIQTAPKTALQLVKYQTIVCQLFSAYPAASALKYDRLFREAAARNKSGLQWDVLKEDILVWCVTRNPFRARQQVQSGSSTSRQGPAPAAGSNQQGDRSLLTSTGQEICRRFNYGKCTKGAECHYAHKCWGHGCGGDHPATACPRTKPAPV